MSEGYDPSSVEAGWSRWWEENHLFQPKSIDLSAGAFNCMLPPPNVTGALHIGHALTISIQDALVRYHRMSGSHTRWTPGLDHAGIATQVAVERHLSRTQQKHRSDMTREEFLQHVWEWKEQYGGRIHDQHRRMGASLDWTNEFFTLDGPRSAAVTEAFVRLHEMGLLYRSCRLVNWCSHLQSAISDIEVDYQEVSGPSTIKVPGSAREVQVGAIHDIAYTVEGSADSTEVIVSTTRPETLFGDTAVAVHPDDDRYRHLHGRQLTLPLTQRSVPVITDSELVDPTLGTGAVKVTPAHDLDDFECGVRNKLRCLTIMDDQGRLNHLAGHFQGRDRLEARASVVEALQQVGLYRGCKPHPGRVALCSRSGDVLEPRIKPQWFVACKEMGRTASTLVADGTIELLPSGVGHHDTWRRWLQDTHDWCVSRQLWWGHRIPAWRVVQTASSAETVDDEDKGTSIDDFVLESGGRIDDTRWLVARTEHDAREQAQRLEREGALPAGAWTLERDHDVLDTWFSSGLLPLSSAGWPSTVDKSLYPLTMMETGSDILFFWVARMVMLCTTLAPESSPPFKTVLLHPMVRDHQGRKMSKSLGNVIDPVDVMTGCTLESMIAKLRDSNLSSAEVKKAEQALRKEMPKGILECGADSLRFTLCHYLTQTRGINLSVDRVHSYRLFCNKIWQCARFVLKHSEHASGTMRGKVLPFVSERRDTRTHPQLLAHRWILSRLHNVVTRCNHAFRSYDLSAATSALHVFFQNELCDVFIEFCKPLLLQSPSTLTGTPLSEHDDAQDLTSCSQELLLDVLETSLRLFHPFMPFLTEELWQRVAGRVVSSSDQLADSIMLAPYPQACDDWLDRQAENDMELLVGVLHTARSLRSQFGKVLPARNGDVKTYISAEGECFDLLTQLTSQLRAQLRSPHVSVQQDGFDDRSDVLSASVPTGHEARISVAVRIESAAAVATELRLREAKHSKRLAILEKLQNKRQGPHYHRVPPHVQEADRVKEEVLQGEIQLSEQSLEALRKCTE